MTIAAIYEADAAATAAEHDPSPSVQAYWQTAWRAEARETELDQVAQADRDSQPV